MDRHSNPASRLFCAQFCLLMVSAFLILHILCPSNLHAQGISQSRPELLIPSTTAVSKDSGDVDPTVMRSRTAYVRFDLLSQLPARDGNILRLNLFDDVTLDAVLTKRIKRSPSSYTWSGHIVGRRLGTFALSVEENVMIGSITLPGEAAYQIRYLSDSLHEIREIDLTRIRPCAGGVPAPSARSEELTNDEQIKTDTGCAVDLLVIYTPAARVQAGGTTAMQALINLAVDTSNITYANSEINLRLRLVYQAEVSYTESGSMGTDLDRLTHPSDGYMDGVHAARNTYGADLVCLFTHDLSSCGLAWLWDDFGDDFNAYAFSIAAWDCAVYYTLAHETGHNMGCAHATPESPQGEGLFNYSMGWRFNSDAYRTVMAYAPGTQVPHFSNPDVTYDGFPTGVPVGLSNEAHNALSINTAASTIANWREHVVPYTPPTAENSDAVAEIGVATTITLDAADEGCPDRMVYIITSLPSHGTLADPGAGTISTGDLPYSLVDNGDQVTYTPSVDCYTGPDSFQFKANDGGTGPTGGDSDIATVSVEVVSLTSTTIGTGTSTWNYPMHTYWHDSRTQVIYLAGEIGASADIAALALYVDLLPGQPLNNWTIRMKHTAMNSYGTPSLDATGWTVVYQADEPVGSTGWRTFNFSTPFEYNNANNLLVDFSHNNGSWTSNGLCRYSSPGGTRTAYAESDSDHGDPLSWSGTSSPSVYGTTSVPNVQLYKTVTVQPPTGDFEPDCDVDWDDVGFLSQRWLHSNCSDGNDWCEGCDLDHSSVVDFPDFAGTAQNWLVGM